MEYCESIFKTKRFKTREVKVGNIGVGADNPIRIQSMTTSDTRDSKKTAEQIMRLADIGCEIARVTVQGMKEAYSCEQIKSLLVQKGYTIPLVADIHFFPKAAMTVADFVDKVRINPGNYVDKRATFKTLEYNDESYALELQRIEEKFSPLVEKCKKLKIAMRIGTNHGSLSDRIMNRYGDSPIGMVESALEFTRVARNLDYHDIIFSMKASNTHVMIQAYRLLVARMMQLQWNYPLHLGVTEAGDGEDGRIKSAVGIGSLLLDGLGDTIRVSLTEDPWFEIDPCKRLINIATKYTEQREYKAFIETTRNPQEYSKRQVILENKPLHVDGSVYLLVTEEEVLRDSFFEDVGCSTQFNQPFHESSTVDALVFRKSVTSKEACEKLEKLRAIGITIIDLKHTTLKILDLKGTCPEDIDFDTYDLILLSLENDKIHRGRDFFERLKKRSSKTPVILSATFKESADDFPLCMGAELGSLLCDGLGEGVMLLGDYSLGFLRKMSFNLLQACRMRSSKTEFISCPSCGRTLFDLQEVTKKIKAKTAHLPGVKIAIMGCIVNGPGEMADADFGYVGSKPDKIDLYVGKERVEKDIDHEMAVDKLVDLLRKHNRWVEPKEAVAINI